jgi:hypothetical protein
LDHEGAFEGAFWGILDDFGGIFAGNVAGAGTVYRDSGGDFAI